MSHKNNEDRVNIMLRMMENNRVNANLAMKNLNNPEFQIESILNGNSDVVRKIIGYGGNIDLPNEAGVTPLMVAFEVGNYELIRTLILAGANINKKDNEGRKPVTYGIINGREQTIEWVRAFFEARMIEYSFSDHNFDVVMNKVQFNYSLLQPLNYRFTVEITLRSGKKQKAEVVSNQTFREFVEHIKWLSVYKKEEFYTGPNFAFRPKDVAYIAIIS